MNEYDYIRLFKKNRNFGGADQEPADANQTNRSEKTPGKLITPFEAKDYSARITPTAPADSGPAALLRRSFKLLGVDLNENFSLLKAGELVKKTPFWSLLKKL